MGLTMGFFPFLFLVVKLIFRKKIGGENEKGMFLCCGMRIDLGIKVSGCKTREPFVVVCVG